MLVLQDQQVLKVLHLRELQEPKGLKVQSVPQVHKELLVQQVTKVERERQVLKVK